MEANGKFVFPDGSFFESPLKIFILCFDMMSHNMYVDVFFALKNNVLKQMLNV